MPFLTGPPLSSHFRVLLTSRLDPHSDDRFNASLNFPFFVGSLHT